MSLAGGRPAGGAGQRRGGDVHSSSALHMDVSTRGQLLLTAVASRRGSLPADAGVTPHGAVCHGPSTLILLTVTPESRPRQLVPAPTDACRTVKRGPRYFCPPVWGPPACFCSGPPPPRRRCQGRRARSLGHVSGGVSHAAGGGSVPGRAGRCADRVTGTSLESAPNASGVPRRPRLRGPWGDATRLPGSAFSPVKWVIIIALHPPQSY